MPTAGRLLVDAELRRGRVRREESRQPEGSVLSQSPAAGERVAIDTAVNLVVATPVTVLVPDLVGQDMTAVGTLLRDTELRRGRTTTEESREPEGTVLSHEPAANRRVAVETEVDLVAATPVTVLVPDLVGLDEAVVDTLLGNTELTRGTVEREESRQPVGTVLTQEPAAGTRVVINTRVAFALTVRLTVVMPDVAGLTEAEALDLLDPVSAYSRIGSLRQTSAASWSSGRRPGPASTSAQASIWWSRRSKPSRSRPSWGCRSMQRARS